MNDADAIRLLREYAGACFDRKWLQEVAVAALAIYRDEQKRSDSVVSEGVLLDLYRDLGNALAACGYLGERRSEHQRMPDKVCAWCHREATFESGRLWFCSDLCKGKLGEMISPPEPIQREPSGDPERDAPE